MCLGLSFLSIGQGNLENTKKVYITVLLLASFKFKVPDIKVDRQASLEARNKIEQQFA